MSDALTDIARDQERYKRTMAYLSALKVFLKHPTPEKRLAVIESVRRLDEYSYHGYWTGPTQESVGIEQRLDKLVGGDSVEWRGFLERINDAYIFIVFKALSPFGGEK